jgi:hypothetical protein
MIFPVMNTMGWPQETNLHGIFHHLSCHLAATYSLQHLLWFSDTGIASFIHLWGSHSRLIGVQAYSECHHYHYVKDDLLWEQNNPPSNFFLLHCNFPWLMLWCSQKTQLCDALWHLLSGGREMEGVKEFRCCDSLHFLVTGLHFKAGMNESVNVDFSRECYFYIM